VSDTAITERPNATAAVAPTPAATPVAPMVHRQRRARRVPPSIAICFVIVGGLILAALFAPLLSPHDPTKQSLLIRNRPPAWLDGGVHGYPLGTDDLGRDVLSRVLFGARVSLGIGFLATIIGTVLGTVLGVIAGYFRGAADWVIMLAVDTQLAMPFIVVAIAAIAAFGKGIPILIVLAGVSGWMLFARACRSTVLSLREREFVMAARALGASNARILTRHILRNLASVVLVIVTIDLRRIILFESTLSFLGLGVQPPTPSWGAMLAKGRELLNTAWWISIFPGAALMLTVLAVSLIGDWLRDVLDPTLRTG
jgi:peptide/nickel transport system permease protein